MTQNDFVKDQLIRWVQTENQSNRLRKPMLAIVTVLIASLCLLLLGRDAGMLVSVWSSLGVLGVALVACGGAIFACRGSLSIPEWMTAASMDRRLASKSRLESAVDLQGVDHPLKEHQMAETARFFGAWPELRSSWPVVRGCLAVAIVGLLIANVWVISSLASPDAIGGVATSQPATQPTTQPAAQAPVVSSAQSQPAEAREAAQLQLTEPQVYHRATLLDDVTLKGNGHSPHGFDKLDLEITIGDKEPTSRPVAGAPLETPNQIELQDVLQMDDLNLEEWDMITYMLVGRTTLDGRGQQEIRSTPQFVIVRPFKEDVGRSAGPGCKDPLMELVNRQFGLINNTYALAGSGEDLSGQAAISQAAELAQEQGGVASDSESFATAGGRFPPQAYEKVASAAKFMHKAQEQFSKQSALTQPGQEAARRADDARENLLSAGVSQKKAIAELMAAVKIIKPKRSYAEGGSGKPPAMLPFNDKQQYIKPKLPEAQNPEKQLETCVASQAKVLDEIGRPFQQQGDPSMNAQGDSTLTSNCKPAPSRDGQDEQPPQASRNSPSGNPKSDPKASGSQPAQQAGNKGSGSKGSGGNGSSGEGKGAQGKGQGNGQGKDGEAQMSKEELTRRQAEITQGLAELARNGKLDPGIRGLVGQAEQASRRTHEAVASGAAKAAMSSGQMAKTDMENALATVREQADNQLQDELAKAQIAIDRAKELNDKGKKPDAGKSAEEGVARVHDQAMKQQESGRHSSAQKLVTLAETLANMHLPEKTAEAGPGATKQASRELERAADMIAQARRNGRDDAAMMADAIVRLKEIEQELKRINASGKKLTGQDLQNLSAQSALASQDVQRAAGEGSGQGSGELGQMASSVAGSIGEALVNPNETIPPGIIASWIPRVHDLIVASRQHLSRLEKVQVIRKFDPEEVPDEYREDVNAYFERLSDVPQQKGDK